MEGARFLNNRLRNREPHSVDAVYQLLSNLARRIVHDGSKPRRGIPSRGAGRRRRALPARVDVLWMPSIYRDLAQLNQLALQLGEVSVFARVALSRALDKLEKVSQVFAFRGLEFGKLDAHAEGGTALGDNAGQD